VSYSWFSFILVMQQQHVTLAVEEAPKKEDGISDKSSSLNLQEEDDLLKAESQDSIVEVKVPYHQVRKNTFPLS